MESECILLIDGRKIVAKIVWKGGSKFKIVECKDNNYIGLVIDASDILLLLFCGLIILSNFNYHLYKTYLI